MLIYKDIFILFKILSIDIDNKNMVVYNINMKKLLQIETEKTLLDVGFSPKEIAVYSALLSLGKGIVTKISRTASIGRTTTYDILDSLSQKGLVKISGKEPRQEYIVESPEKLEQYIVNEIEKKNTDLNKIKYIIPELFSLYNTKEIPKVRYYEGVEGLKRALEDTLSKSDIEILASGGALDMFESVGEEYSREYFRKRVEKNIKIRGIASSDSGTIEVSKRNEQELREILIVPNDKFHFSVETNIYNGKVLNISWKEKFAVLIESKEIADAQKKVFELAWLGAKSLKNN
jgi:sugar-specific transcriptional regulator TrmB